MPSRRPFAASSFAACAALLCAACGTKIGDECKTSIDCSQEAEHTCDISQPGGYCTVEGCDERSCPEEAVCIRFFPSRFLPKTCAQGCTSDEICLEDDRCAPRIAELRYCARICDDGGDCRGGYACRLAGTAGSLALVATPGSRVSFCAPAPK